MLITNLTDVDYWFGPMRLPAAASGFYLDDTSDTSLYLLNDEVADAVNTLSLASPPLIMVTSAALPFPRPTGTPSLLHGDGSPEGMVYAPQGSLYMRRDTGQASTSLYSKQTGVTENTGWASVIGPAAGDLVPCAAPSPRVGCLLCDGTSYLQSSYPVLFEAIGTAYGSVDGSHFNVPDLRGRVPVGSGTGTASSASTWTLGSQPVSGAGGEEQTSLSTSQNGPHTHDFTTSTNYADGSGANKFAQVPSGDTIVSSAAQGWSSGGKVLVPVANADLLWGGVVPSHDHSGTTDGGGATGAGHNTMQPVSVINWFIVHG